MANGWPVTAAQRKARRANARKSRGPKTPDGLAKCKQAPLLHGWYSAETKADYKAFRALDKWFHKTLQGEYSLPPLDLPENVGQHLLTLPLFFRKTRNPAPSST